MPHLGDSKRVLHTKGQHSVQHDKLPFLTTQAELFSSGLGVNTTDVGRRVDAEGRRTQRKEGVSDL